MPTRFYDRNDRRLVYDYNSNLNQGFGRDAKTRTTETTGLSKFFIDYHSHSEQLVDALQEWSRKVRFTLCKYEQGFFDIDNQEPVESMNKGFTGYMKKHLEKEPVYQEQILTPIIEIEREHKQSCEEMKNLIVDGTQVRPSFQLMINNKIKASCPKLKKTRNRELEENNVYIESDIFKVIFGQIINNKSNVILKIGPSDNFANSNVLKYMDLFAFAQGESSEIERLKSAVEQLVIDNDLKQRVERYIKLEKLLTNYEKLDGLRDKIDELWTFVHGGGYLGGFDACQLCDPSKSAPTRT